MELAYKFSLVLFTAFAIYVYIGIYILFLNKKNILNRIFFVLSLTVCLWSFCLSIANSAPDYETALFWRKMSSLGWGSAHSVLLHFLIIMTERSRVLKKKGLYFLLYFPVIINVFVFGFGNNIIDGLYTYKLFNSEYGWVNLSKNFWDMYFNIYYISFALVGFGLLWNWGRKSIEAEKKKEAFILTVSYGTSVLVATMTDAIINSYTSIRVPQLAPVIMLIPQITIFYTIKRHGLIGFLKNEETRSGKILNEFNLVEFYWVLSLLFILGGLQNFMFKYFIYHEPLNSVMILSSIYLVYGFVLQLFRKLQKRGDLEDTIFVIFVSSSIPLITLSYMDRGISTSWAIPFIFVILSVIYNKRRMMFCLGISTLLTQIWVWIKIPITTIQIDGSVYISRISISIVILYLAFYVNKVYIKRLNENEAQIWFQKVVSQISADFVKVSEINLDKKINGMLQYSNEFFQADRTYLTSLSDDLKNYNWCKESIAFEKEVFVKVSEDDFPWWCKQLAKNEVIHISDVKMLSPEAYREKTKFEQFNIKSLISIPLIIRGKTMGFLFFASTKKDKIWREDHQDLLRILANLLTDALVKVEVEKEITYMAYYDELTGLPNRTLFKNRLEQAIHLAGRVEKLICVILIDLDSFKAINDTVGHEGGDEILKQLAVRLSEHLRKQDTVSRFGGDVFLIKINQINQIEDIKKIADAIMNSFAQPITVKDQEFFITASAGIAVYPVDGEDAETLIKNADLAMYTSKDKGKNQYTLCSPDIKKDVLKKMQLTNFLYRALDRNEFVLYYQPQVSVLTKEIVGLEALIRWNHPELGMIAPANFIPLAEQTGLISPISEWVIKTACQQNKRWQMMGMTPLRMAVNLSVKQFRNSDLISLISRTLSETSLESKYLELEITESTAVSETHNIIYVLRELKKLGVTIAIDDFGTEYSSLSRLKSLPVDRIKIDRQFVRGISEGNKDEAIAKTIIQLAKNLDLKVIAEGVETENQFEFFKKEMCDEIQGFYFYKPMPATEIDAILLSNVKRKK